MRAIYLLNFQFYCILLLWLFSSAIAVVLDQPGEQKLGFCGNQDNQQIQMASTLGGVRESSKTENSAEIENIARYAVQEHNKKEFIFSFAPKPDEATGPFPEAVLLKERKTKEDGWLMPEFADVEERELFEFLKLELESDTGVGQRTKRTK